MILIAIHVFEITRQQSNISSKHLEDACPSGIVFGKSKTVVLVFQHCRTAQVNSCNWTTTIAALLPFCVLCKFYSQ